MAAGRAIGVALICVWSCALAMNALAQEEERKPVSLPEGLAGQIRKDFEVEACFQEDQPAVEKQIKAEELVLTTTTTAALLVTGVGDCLAGAADNAPYLIYAKFGNNWRKILRTEGEAIRPLPAMHNGWHDVEVSFRNSRSESLLYTYRFNKTDYRAEACESLVTPGNSSQPQRKACPGWKAK